MMVPPVQEQVVHAQRDEASALAEVFVAADRGDIAPVRRLVPTLRDPALAALARARVAASLLDHSGTRRALANFFALGAGRMRMNAWAWSIGAADAFADGDYRSAASQARRWVQLLTVYDPGGELRDARQLEGVSRLLAPAGRQRGTPRGERSAAVVRDQVGLVRSTVNVGGHSAAAVLDTGANLSVVSAALAARMGMRMLSGSSDVGSAARDAVPVRVGIAAHVDFAGVRLRNVAFLVLDERDLALPIPGYRIDMIIGFPVLQAMRSVTVTGDKLVVGAGSVTDGPAGNMHTNGNDLDVDVSIDGVAISLQLDTGAATSSLSTLFASGHPALATSSARSVRSAGAGGSTQVETASLKDATVAIGGLSSVIPSIDVEVGRSADVEAKGYGRIGQDILRAYRSYTIDFRTMSLSVR